MRSLVKTIVVNFCWLVEEHLFACRLDRSHHLLVFSCQVEEIKLFLLDEEEGGAHSDRGYSLLFQFKHVHSLIVAGSEVI